MFGADSSNRVIIEAGRPFRAINSESESFTLKEIKELEGQLECWIGVGRIVLINR
jgi:hypothetical protein